MSEELKISITSQGDTSGASQVTIESGTLAQKGRDLVLRARICDEGGFTNATNATIAPATNGGATLVSHTSNKDLDIRSPQAVAATGTLTLTGVVTDGEYATVGNRVFEFDTDGVTTQGRFVVDISASAMASQGTLTLDTQPTADDTVTIGSTVYTFKATSSTVLEIALGSDLAATQAAIVARINGADYWRTKHTLVSAGDFASDDCILTARKAGTAGDSIATTETFTAVTNVFDAATLGTTTAGVDCTAANAITALVAAITADVTSDVTAADGAGDTVTITAADAGTAGNSISTTEAMTNASFGATTLMGGVDSTAGKIVLDIIDETAETVTLRIGAAQFGSDATDFSASNINITHA